MALTYVDRADALRPGDRRRVIADGRPVAVFRVGDRFYAVADRCPHQGASLSEGRICKDVSATEPGRYRLDPSRPHVRCPWHGWEFDLATGRSRCDPGRVRVRRFETRLVADRATEAPPTAETFATRLVEGGLYVET